MIMEMSFFIYLISIFKYEFLYNGYHLIFRAIQLNFPKKKNKLFFVLFNYLMYAFK